MQIGLYFLYSLFPSGHTGIFTAPGSLRDDIPTDSIAVVIPFQVRFDFHVFAKAPFTFAFLIKPSYMYSFYSD